MHVVRDHPASTLHVNSCRCPPQECARILGNLVDQSSVSRDLPSFRWRPSTQATSLAMATKSPSQDLALVTLFTGHTFFCNLRQLSKPWSPPAGITISKPSPSVRSERSDKTKKLSVYLCRHLRLRFQGRRGGNTRHVVPDLLGTHVEVFLSP